MTQDPDHHSNIDERSAETAASAVPSSLGARLADLPRQYLHVFTKPDASTFAQELDKASWVLVCLQLLALLVIQLAYTALAAAQHPQVPQPLSSTPLGAMLNVLSSLLVVGLTWVLARVLGGRGSLLAQSYTMLLILVPFSLLGDLLALLIPVVSPLRLGIIEVLAGLVLVVGAVVYVISLQVSATMAVHLLSGWKAFVAVFLSLLILGLGNAFLSAQVPSLRQASPATLQSPEEIIAGPGGNFWFTTETNTIGRITLQGQITAFSVGADYNGSHDIIAGSDGSLWFTDLEQKLGRITPQGQISTFAVTAESGAFATGPDGTLWFSDSGTNRIGRITTDGHITEFAIPTKDSSPAQMTSGPDGAIWFSEGIGKIGRITTNGTITEFAIPAKYSSPDQIIAGADGAIWFADEASNSIGRVTTKGSITEFALPTKDLGLVKLIAGSDGTIWFLEVGQGIWKLGRITTSGRISQFTFTATDLLPEGMTAGPDGALWFTEELRNRIDRITAQGTITEFAVPTPESLPKGITTGPDRALWFTENASNKIGRITTAGSITEFALPT